MLVVAVAQGGDGFAVRDLGSAEIDVDVALGLHQLGGDIDVHIAQTLEHDFLGLGIFLDQQRGVLVAQAVDGGAHLVLIDLRVGRECHVHDRVGEVDGCDLHGLARRNQRVAGTGSLQFRDGDDLARAGGVGRDLLLADRMNKGTG